MIVTMFCEYRIWIREINDRNAKKDGSEELVIFC